MLTLAVFYCVVRNSQNSLQLNMLKDVTHSRADQPKSEFMSVSQVLCIFFPYVIFLTYYIDMHTHVPTHTGKYADTCQSQLFPNL